MVGKFIVIRWGECSSIRGSFRLAGVTPAPPPQPPRSTRISHRRLLANPQEHSAFVAVLPWNMIIRGRRAFQLLCLPADLSPSSFLISVCLGRVPLAKPSMTSASGRLRSLHASACKYTAQIISPPTEFMQRACCKDLWCSAREGSQSDIW